MANNRKRNHYKDIILKISQFVGSVTDDVTEYEISTQYDRCVEAWRCYQEVHLDILQVTGDEFVEFEKIEFDAIEKVTVKMIAGFKKRPFCERQAFVDENKLYLNCLSVGHKVSSCPSTYTCRVCQQKHNTLLHVTKQSSNVTSTVSNGCQSDQGFATLLATAVVHVKLSTGLKVQLRALIDQGSQISFITLSAAKRLALRMNDGGPAVKAVGTNGYIKTKGIADLRFFSRFGTGADSDYQISVTILDRITGQLPSEIINWRLLFNWKRLPLADPKFRQPGSIDLLLGADVVANILQNGLFRIPDQNVIAQKSTLGWLLSGNVKLTNPIPTVVTGTLAEEENESEKICERLRAFWEIENVDKQNVMDPDDQLCEEHFRNTHYRDDNGRFVVRLPFKPSFGNLVHLGKSRNEIMTEEHRQAMLDTEMEFTELLANDGVTWHFSPPSAPHFNGLAEAGVRSMKYHLRRIIGSTLLTFEEFYTILCQIEGVLNSRPISALTDDFSDLTVLTPGHFLMGSAPIMLPEPTLLNVKENRLTRWQLLEQMKQRFWKVWSADYLSSLQQRPRWQQECENLSVGQLVLIRQDNLPPIKWLLGRIEAVHPGNDGLVRVATVRTQNSTLKRPVVKLCPLPSPQATEERENPPGIQPLEDQPQN